MKENLWKHKIFGKRILKLKYNTNNFDERKAHQNNNYLALHQEIVLRKSNYYLIKNYFIYLCWSTTIFIIINLITWALFIFLATHKGELEKANTKLWDSGDITLLFKDKFLASLFFGYLFSFLNFFLLLFNSVNYRPAFALYQKAYWTLKNGNQQESLNIENKPLVFKGIKIKDNEKNKFKNLDELPSVKFFDYKAFGYFMKPSAIIIDILELGAALLVIIYAFLLA